MADLNELNYINVGPHGTFKPSGDLHTTPEDVNSLIAYIKKEKIQKLALHFHGGLVGEGGGKKIVERLTSEYEAAGCHPIFFIWESGLLETLSSNINTIHSTDLAQLIMKYVLQKVEKTFAVATGVKGPDEEMSFEEIEAELSKKVPFLDKDEEARVGAKTLDEVEIHGFQGKFKEEIQNALVMDTKINSILADDVPDMLVLDEEFKTEVEDKDGTKGGAVTVYVAKKIAGIIVEVIKRFHKRIDHGLYPTVIEELLRAMYIADLAAWVWGGMKDKAIEMWEPNTGPVNEESKAGSYFLEKLSELQDKLPDSKISIDLIGHSAGGIVICHLLAAIADHYEGINTRNILFLAPGSSSQLFHDEIAKNPERFDTFRMFTMDDDYEKEAPVLPGIYTRSLLYFLSGVLEDKPDKPIVGLERYLSGSPPYDDEMLMFVKSFLYEQGKNRIVLSKTIDSAGEGLRSSAIDHGAFDNDALTLESIKAVISG